MILTALEQGYTLASPVEDTPLSIPNYDGSEWTTATRLTFHTGNDQWPDIYVTAGGN